MTSTDSSKRLGFLASLLNRLPYPVRKALVGAGALLAAAFVLALVVGHLDRLASTSILVLARTLASHLVYAVPLAAVLVRADIEIDARQ